MADKRSLPAKEGRGRLRVGSIWGQVIDEYERQTRKPPKKYKGPGIGEVKDITKEYNAKPKKKRK